MIVSFARDCGLDRHDNAKEVMHHFSPQKIIFKNLVKVLPLLDKLSTKQYCETGLLWSVFEVFPKFWISKQIGFYDRNSPCL